MHVLAHLKARDFAAAEPALEAIRPLESMREKISPIRVLHEAVRLAGVADTGPLYPMLSNLEADRHPAVLEACGRLMEAERALSALSAAAE
jgi:dihydrodipicolinate synthase/N-acetylneuraminate lyase